MSFSRRMSSLPARQLGFSLLEVLLALGITLGVGTLALNEIVRRNEAALARAVGQELKTVGQSLNTYVALRYTQLVNLTDVAGAGTSADPGPRDCDPATGICVVTTDTLRRNGLLPTNFSGRTAFGAEYEYYIRVSGAAPNWIVDGFVIADQPFTNGEINPRYDLLGQAMLEAGADSAMTRSVGTRLEGLNGAWSENNFQGLNEDGDQAINALGLLGYRAGYGSSAYAAFLRLDGGTMTGDLNLGNNNILGINDIETVRVMASGSLNVLASAAGADMVVLGTNPDGTPIAGTSSSLGIDNAGRMIVTNPNGVRLESSTAPGTLTNIDAADGNFEDVFTTGQVAAQGNVSGLLLESTSDVIATRDVIANRDLQVAGSATVVGDVTVNGLVDAVDMQAVDLVVNDSLTLTGANASNSAIIASNATNINGWRACPGGNCANQHGWYVTSADPTTLRTFGANVGLSGQLSAGSVRTAAGGNVIAGGVIQVNGAAVLSTACTLPGAIANAGTTLAQCIGGVWTPFGVKGNVRILGNLVSCPTATAADLNDVTGVAGGCAPGSVVTSTAQCPAGKHLAGGGYAMTQFRPFNYRCERITFANGNYDSLCTAAHRNATAPSVSAPNASEDSWVVEAGHMNAANEFQAYAVCVD